MYRLIKQIPEAELTAIWRATEKLTSFDVIVRLLILTGQRKNEIARLRDEMIGKDCITLPRQLTKNSRTHFYPVGSMTLALLPQRNGYLFPARDSDDRPFSGWSICKERLDARSGVSDWTLHDLRRTFRTNWAALGMNREVAEKYINHASGVHSGINSIYDRHNYAKEMREAVAAWETHLQHLIVHDCRLDRP